MAEVAIKAVEAVFDWRTYLKEEFGLTDEELGAPAEEPAAGEAEI